MLVHTMHYGFIMFLLKKYGVKVYEIQNRLLLWKCVLSGATLGFMLQSPYTAVYSLIHT
jgi:hypothetical protein